MTVRWHAGCRARCHPEASGTFCYAIVPVEISAFTSHAVKADILPLSSMCSGIMNGLDTLEWNPAVDALLPEHIHFKGSADVAEGKANAKELLQLKLGLRIQAEARLMPHCSLMHNT